VRPAIATVVGPDWEPRLVAHARRSGLARLIGRCCDPADLATLAERCDAVFVGSESPWLIGVDLSDLTTCTRVIGVAADAPGRRLLEHAGVSEVIDATTPPAGMLSVVLMVETPPGRLIEVTGPRGAPGRSEVALALAHALGTGAALIEADDRAPSLGLRMGLTPAPTRTLHLMGGLTLSPAPARARVDDPIGPFVELVRNRHPATIIDAGPNSTWHRTMDVDDVIVVGEATDVGVVRLARLCDTWLGPTPLLVINRHRSDQDLRRVRRATGLEPAAVIPHLPELPLGREPAAPMRAALRTAATQRTAL
jgi:hypothetical protein